MTTIPQRYKRTDGRTDRRTTCLGNTALRVASRGNKISDRQRYEQQKIEFHERSPDSGEM